MATIIASKELVCRLVVLGDYAVGKSSIACRYVRNEFHQNEESTIGAAFVSRTIFCRGNYIKYEIWDTAGQERYNSLIPMYYRGAQVALIVYDITSRRSFDRAKSWVLELSQEKPKDFLKVIVGNKSDLEESREVSFAEGCEYAHTNNLLFYETSAKDGTNIESVFSDIAGVLPSAEEGDRDVVINLRKQKKGFGCC